MIQILKIIIFSILVCVTLVASAASTEIQTITSTTIIKTSTDENIVSAIYDQYAKHSALIGTSLTVSSENGIVTISGTVTAQSQADAAITEAKSIKGVKAVRSNIKVITNPNLNEPSEPPKY